MDDSRLCKNRVCHIIDEDVRPTQNHDCQYPLTGRYSKFKQARDSMDIWELTCQSAFRYVTIQRFGTMADEESFDVPIRGLAIAEVEVEVYCDDDLASDDIHDAEPDDVCSDEAPEMGKSEPDT